MARKIKRIGRLPQLPNEINTGNKGQRDKYSVDLSRALFDHQYALDQLINNTNTGGTDANAFATVAVPGQSNVVADSVSDTLNIVGGSGIGITTNASTDTVTITSTGGGSPGTGEHLLLLGDISAAQDAADAALGFVGSNTTIIQGGSFWLFGNGADGLVHFDGTNTFSFATKVGNVYTLLRPVYSTDCIIDASVTVQAFDYASPGTGGGQQIYCTGTFTNNGLCGGNGQRNLVNLYVGGVGASAGVNGIFLYGSNGGDGGRVSSPITGRPGSAVSQGWGGNGGAGGASSTPNAGGAGGVVTTPTGDVTGGVNVISFPWTMIQGRTPYNTGSAIWQMLMGGAGGGGGGCVSGSVEGGAGGGGGGVFLVAARYIAVASGILSCDGADGNVGSGGSGNGAGGGGGGGGGLLLIITTSANYASNLTCRAIGGTGGAQVGGIGVAGSNGSNGRVVALVVT